MSISYVNIPLIMNKTTFVQYKAVSYVENCWVKTTHFCSIILSIFLENINVQNNNMFITLNNMPTIK